MDLALFFAWREMEKRGKFLEEPAPPIHPRLSNFYGQCASVAFMGATAGVVLAIGVTFAIAERFARTGTAAAPDAFAAAAFPMCIGHIIAPGGGTSQLEPSVPATTGGGANAWTFRIQSVALIPVRTTSTRNATGIVGIQVELIGGRHFGNA